MPWHHSMPQVPVPPVDGDALPARGDPVRTASPPRVRGRSALKVCWDGKARVS
jgi:hypothetical protein